MEQNKIAILALTERLYATAKTQLANGQQVSQEDMAILNRARKQIAITRAQFGLTETLTHKEHDHV